MSIAKTLLPGLFALLLSGTMTHATSPPSITVPFSNLSFSSSRPSSKLDVAISAASASAQAPSFSSNSPSKLDEVLLTHEAQQTYQDFWMAVQGTYAVLAINNLPYSEAVSRFTAIVDQYTTDDVHLSFPLGGLNSTGKRGLIDALVGQTLGMPGNGGEHHVSSFPLVKRVSASGITLSINDIAYVRGRDNTGSVFLGRKTFSFTRARRPNREEQLLISELILEVRSYFPQAGGLPTWFLLEQPSIEQ